MHPIYVGTSNLKQTGGFVYLFFLWEYDIVKDWLAKEHYQLPIWSLCCPEFLPEWQLHQQSSLIFKVETGELRFKRCLIKTLTMMFVLRFIFGNDGEDQEIDPKNWAQHSEFEALARTSEDI